MTILQAIGRLLQQARKCFIAGLCKCTGWSNKNRTLFQLQHIFYFIALEVAAVDQ